MLSASDPYYVAKEEVAKAMEKLQGVANETESLAGEEEKGVVNEVPN